MGDRSVPDIGRLTLTVKTEDIIHDATEFRDGRTENAKNYKNKKSESALILMVRYNKLTVDQLKRFLENCDPNYYSPITEKSAFSYAVEQKNLTFAQVLLNKMSGKNESDREYLQRDLENLSKQLDLNSEIFKIACKDYHGKEIYNERVDSKEFISAIADALIDKKTIDKKKTSQKGYFLKRGNATLRRSGTNVTVQENNHDFKRKQFLRHFSTILYYKWKEEYKSLYEVQAMWVSFTEDDKKKSKSL